MHGFIKFVLNGIGYTVTKTENMDVLKGVIVELKDCNAALAKDNTELQAQVFDFCAERDEHLKEIERLQATCDAIAQERNNLHVDLVRLTEEKETHLDTIRLTTQAIENNNRMHEQLAHVEASLSEPSPTTTKKPRGKKITAQTNGN